MAIPSTIPLNDKYALNLSSMNSIQTGDTFKSVNALRRAVIDGYADTNPSGGVKTLIDNAIKPFLQYTKASGYSITITHITPINHVSLSSLQQTSRKKLSFKGYIETLFHHFIITQPDDTYLTTAQLIKELGIFGSFYYDYTKTHYDRRFSSRMEYFKVQKVLTEYGLLQDEDYITERMEKLQEIVYTVFNKTTIEKIAEGIDITAKKLWYSEDGVCDPHFVAHWEHNYITPLLKKRIPPKYITRMANRNYRKDNNISESDHHYIYSIWHFSKKDIVLCKPLPHGTVDTKKQELNQNFIEKLKRASVDVIGNNYHANHITVLNDLINEISI